MWYLDRMVTAAEFALLADIPGFTPQRDDEGSGTYVFAPTLATTRALAELNTAASGYWRRVA
jgi:hypothetical protein